MPQIEIISLVRKLLGFLKLTKTRSQPKLGPVVDVHRFSASSWKNLDGVHPKLERVAIEALASSPYDFGVCQGVRTDEEQQELYDKGRKTEGPIVTWTLKSKHKIQRSGYGHAIDIMVFIDGELTWEPQYYIEIADCFKQAAGRLGCRIVWGGDWTIKKDWGHYELDTRKT